MDMVLTSRDIWHILQQELGSKYTIDPIDPNLQFRLHVTFVYPPIPIRDFDWQVSSVEFDGADDAGHSEHQVIGTGKTRDDAINSFVIQLWEREYV